MKRSTTQTIVVALWALAGSSLALAAEPAVPRIGVVTIERLGTDTAVGKQYGAQLAKLQNELRAEGEKREAALTKLDERLKQQRDQFEKDQATLSPEVSEQRQQAISRLMRERESYRQESEDVLGTLQRRVEREQQRLNSKLEEVLRSVIDAVVAERGLDLVLDRRVCLAASAAVDITEDVIRRVDAPTAKAPKPPTK